MRGAGIAMLLAACSFDPTPATSTDAGLIAQPDAASTMQPDPCSNNNGGCAVACTSVDGSAVCFAPETCGQVVGLADNTSTTLYVGGSASKPWTAYCHGGLEYLTVSSATNFGQYTAGGASTGSNVRTTYSRIRVEPTTLAVDICDQAFATSAGALLHSGTTPVSSMPLGVAMDCDGYYSASGVASVDLTSTPFVLASAWVTNGSYQNGAAVTSNTNQTVSISGGGYCGWNAPTGAPENPFNTFTNSELIKLSYMNP
jgi:GON domain